jgi:hypothetical protein
MSKAWIDAIAPLVAAAALDHQETCFLSGQLQIPGSDDYWTKEELKKMAAKYDETDFDGGRPLGDYSFDAMRRVIKRALEAALTGVEVK